MLYDQYGNELLNISELDITTSHEPDIWIPLSVNKNFEMMMTITDCEFDENVFQEIIKHPWNDHKFDITYPIMIQARRHKKKRINKKWQKRYGYKQVMVTSKDWKLSEYDSGTYEFIKEVINGNYN